MFLKNCWILRLRVRLPKQELLVRQAILVERLCGQVPGDGETLVWPTHPLKEIAHPNMYNTGQGPELLLW